MSMYPIANGTVTTNGGSVTFNNIPQNFAHLQIRIFGRGTLNNSGNGLSVIFGTNNTFTSTYRHYLLGSGSGVASSYSTGFATLALLPDATQNSALYGIHIIDFLDYNNTNKNKVLRWLGGYDANGSGFVGIGSTSGFGDTTATTSISVTCDGGFYAGSVISLYGISNSNVTGA